MRKIADYETLAHLPANGISQVSHLNFLGLADAETVRAEDYKMKYSREQKHRPRAELFFRVFPQSSQSSVVLALATSAAFSALSGHKELSVCVIVAHKPYSMPFNKKPTHEQVNQTKTENAVHVVNKHI